MVSRSAKPVTVTLGPMTEAAQRHLESGRFASLSEVVRAGLRALEREEAALDAILKARVEAALADPQPSIDSDAVFADLRAHHARRSGREG
jgi:antitoxin ParD1/3/4